MWPILCFFLILKDENMRPKVFFYYLCHADNDIVVGLDCEHKFNILIPQFRSIIPCEVLLYIEATFLGFIH